MQLRSKSLEKFRLHCNLARTARLPLEWNRRGSWLGEHLPEDRLDLPRSSSFPQAFAIEVRAAETARLGAFELHECYGEAGAKRNSNAVRSAWSVGRFYHWLVVNFRPEVVVEFGTAFGISGMFWLSALEANATGELVTFEVNETWRQVAIGNMAAISPRFRSIPGAFEDRVDEGLQGRKIDIAFIDAIHTSEWVLPQFERVMQRMNAGGLVAVDDIDFSDDMREVWQTVSSDPRVSAAVTVSGRLGLLEVAAA